MSLVYADLDKTAHGPHGAKPVQVRHGGNCVHWADIHHVSQFAYTVLHESTTQNRLCSRRDACSALSDAPCRCPLGVELHGSVCVTELNEFRDVDGEVGLD